MVKEYSRLVGRLDKDNDCSQDDHDPSLCLRKEEVMISFNDTLIFNDQNESGPTAGKELQLNFGPQPSGDTTQAMIEFNFSAVHLGQAVALLLPAIQAAREAAHHSGKYAMWDYNFELSGERGHWTLTSTDASGQTETYHEASLPAVQHDISGILIEL